MELNEFEEFQMLNHNIHKIVNTMDKLVPVMERTKDMLNTIDSSLEKGLASIAEMIETK